MKTRRRGSKVRRRTSRRARGGGWLSGLFGRKSKPLSSSIPNTEFNQLSTQSQLAIEVEYFLKEYKDNESTYKSEKLLGEEVYNKIAKVLKQLKKVVSSNTKQETATLDSLESSFKTLKINLTLLKEEGRSNYSNPHSIQDYVEKAADAYLDLKFALNPETYQNYLRSNE